MYGNFVTVINFHFFPFRYNISRIFSRSRAVSCPFRFPWDSHGKIEYPEFPFAMHASAVDRNGVGER